MIGVRRNYFPRVCALIAASLIIAACSQDSGSTSSSTPTSTPTGSNTAPPPSKPESISLQGTPPATVAADSNYYFQPQRSVSSSVVTFKISGLPAWAHFDSSSGALSGIPQLTDQGTSGHIVISASNDTTSTSMAPFVIHVTAPANNSGAIRLSWEAPTENTDGTPVSDLAGFYIYYGTDAENLTSKITVNSASATSYVVKGLESGAYYFTVVAVNAAGLSSGKSNLANDTVGT